MFSFLASKGSVVDNASAGGGLPYQNYIGWDMSVTQEGIPVLIEYNTRPAAEIKQISSGPVFSKIFDDD